MLDMQSLKNKFGYASLFVNNKPNESIVLKLDNVLYPRNNQSPITYGAGDSRMIALYLEYADFIEKGGTPQTWKGDQRVIKFDMELMNG